jgi:hypothetical protein
MTRRTLHTTQLANGWITLAYSNATSRQGCQIFLGTSYQIGIDVQNYHKICQMANIMYQIAVK